MEQGQKVILPSYTCIPAIDAARWSGAAPHFVDIELNTYNPRFVSSITKIKGIGAISLSYLYGLIGDLNPFLDYAKDANIPVIEDSAIALGGSYKGRKAGSIGDAGIFSLQESKIITSWRGGVITTNNKELYEYMNSLRENLEFPSTPKLMFNLLFSYKRSRLSNPRLYYSTMYLLKRIMTSKRLKPLLANIMGFNPTESIDGVSPDLMPKTDKYNITNLQSRVGLKGLDKIDSITKKRRRLARLLSEELDDLGVIVPQEDKGIIHAYGRFPVRINGHNKFQLYRYFLKNGIETSLNYPYITPNTKFMKSLDSGDYPNAEKASRETILLPFHTFLKEKDIFIMVDSIKKLLKSDMV